MNETLRQVLLALEERLLNPDIRKQRAVAATMLADDFREFGKSGQVYNRERVLTLLEVEDPQRVAIGEFRVELLGPEAALATYTSKTASGSRAHRSSVWVYRHGRWQMLFHQGTLA